MTRAAAPPNHKPIRPCLLAKKETLKRKFDAQYDDPESSHLDFYSEKKAEIAVQLALSHRFPPSDRRLPT